MKYVPKNQHQYALRTFLFVWNHKLIKTSDGAGTDKTKRLDAINKVVYEVFPEPNRQLLQRYLPRMLLFQILSPKVLCLGLSFCKNMSSSVYIF